LSFSEHVESFVQFTFENIQIVFLPSYFVHTCQYRWYRQGVFNILRQKGAKSRFSGPGASIHKDTKFRNTLSKTCFSGLNSW